MKQRITLYVDGDMWREFRAACIRHGITASGLVEIHMREQMTAWMLDGSLKVKDTDQDTIGGQTKTAKRIVEE